jgi:hypothetical protein
MVELSGDESRLRVAYEQARANFESIARAKHGTASQPLVLEAVGKPESEALFVLCNLSALNLARVTIPNFVTIAPKRGFLGRKSYPRGYVAELNQRVREVQAHIDQLLADGFIAGLAIATMRGEELEFGTNTPIYPDPAIQWFWENASESIWEDLDRDPVESDMLDTLSSGDVALLSRYADDAQRRLGQEADPILSSVVGEYIARRGYALYWVHTKNISTRFRKEHFTWVAQQMGDLPRPS